jgi:hypothetical protein
LAEHLIRPAVDRAIFPDQPKLAKLHGFFLIKTDIFRKWSIKAGILLGVGTISSGTVHAPGYHQGSPSENRSEKGYPPEYPRDWE